MSAPLLLLVLFDGLGHEIFQEHYSKFGNLSKFYQGSPKIKDGIVAAFPTSTSPNMMSIATGLYPETHGITDNNMSVSGDDDLSKYKVKQFNFWTESDEDGAWWDNGFNMPIYTLNELKSNESVPRVSGSMLWMGSGAPYRNHTIHHYRPYLRNTSWHEEVDTVMEWFTAKNNPTNCVFLYFDEPDEAGHKFGINSELYLEALQRVNDIVGYLVMKIEENNLKDSLNVIMTADHGMVDIPLNHYNEIYKLNISDGLYNQTGMTIYPTKGNFDKVYNLFHQGSMHMNYSVWKKEDFPESAHYKNGLHVGPIILVTDNGFSTVQKIYPNAKVVGHHGYNNSYSAMRAFFMAQGPAFNASAQVNTINNVDLYPLMCFILKLHPPQNNGSFKIVSSILNKFESNVPFSTEEPKINVPATGVGIVLVLLSVFALSFFIYRMYSKYGVKKNYKYGLVESGSPFLSGSDDDDL